ncbi:hypothetical protein PRIPAC_97199 [Pristionchus pacificus]|nr:hypothetical protein PRIPAC_97199 [Pristionchus pacificus]
MERMNNRFNEEGWNEMLSKTRDLEEEVDELRRENNRTLSLNKKMAKDMIVLEKELEGTHQLQIECEKLKNLNKELREQLTIATRLNDGCYNQKRKDEQSIQEYRQKRDKEKARRIKAERESMELKKENELLKTNKRSLEEDIEKLMQWGADSSNRHNRDLCSGDNEEVKQNQDRPSDGNRVKRNDMERDVRRMGGDWLGWRNHEVSIHQYFCPIVNIVEVS